MALTHLSPRTLDEYACTARRFEADMGKPIIQATGDDARAWLHVLRERGISIATCRKHLSALNHLTGLSVRPQGLPTPVKAPQPGLTIAEAARMLELMKPQDRILFSEILMCGSLEGVALTPRDLNRRLKAYARKAQIGWPVTLRFWLEAAHALGGQVKRRIPAVFDTLGSAATGRDPRLHGIGRRTKQAVTAGD